MTAPNGRLGRSYQVRTALSSVAGVSWRLLVVVAAIALVGYLLGKVWVVVLPLVLALFVSAVLWPAARFLRTHKWPPALSFLAILIGILAVIVVPVAAQAEEVTDGITGGLASVQDWLGGPPLNLADDQVGAALDQGLAKLQESVGDIVGIVLGGITTIGDALVTVGLVLVLVFFYLKDGPRLLPWLKEQSRRRAAPHVTVLATRYFETLGSFMRMQGIVGLIDALFIGIGLLLTGVPLVLPLAVLVFVGAFVPVIGAFVAGGVAVLVALVSNGFGAALIVLVIIVVVQQLEGNVIEPILQSRGLHLHAAVIILAVIAGGSLAGVIGAFLAVPVAALIAITWRYVNEQLDRDPVTTSSTAPVRTSVEDKGSIVERAAVAQPRKGKGTTTSE
jgi:predicted PurR-regulated permease PerM